MNNEVAEITAGFKATTTTMSRPSDGLNMAPDLQERRSADLM
jgi:hypothetical protein